MRLPVILGVVLVICQPGVVFAQSLTNGTFDGNVDGWPAGDKSTVVWDPLDAGGSPTSGSALVTNISDTAGDASGPEQCVDGVVEGKMYRVGADIFVPEGQAETGSANLLLRWYDEGCAGYGSQTGPFVASRGIGTSDAGAWLTVGAVAAAPPGTQSAHIRLSVRQTGTSGTLTSHFDNVSFEPMGRELSFVPAAGYAAGNAGSFWVTDLDVNNPGGQPMTYEIWWLPRQSPNIDPIASGSFSLAAGETRRHANVLGEVFGLDPAAGPFGAIAIAADGKGALVMARIFNQPQSSGEGTFGQSIPGVAMEDGFGPKGKQRIVFMSENTDFRANVGCQNMSYSSANLNLELFDNTGTSLGSTGMSLLPYSNNQLNQILHAWAPVEGYVDVSTTTAGALIYCYGSVIDNASSDPTTVLPR